MVEKWKCAAPFQRPHRGCTIPTFSKFQTLGVSNNKRPTNYLDLAFCLMAGEAADAGFEEGSVTVEGLTESYKLKHLQQNRNDVKRIKGCSCFVGMILRAHKRISYKEATHRFLIFFTKALTALTILLIRTCHQNNRWVSAFKQFSGIFQSSLMHSYSITSISYFQLFFITSL